MKPTTLLLSAALAVLVAAPTRAQVTTGGAGNTGVQAPATTGGVPAGSVGLERAGEPHNVAAAAQGNATVPGTTPGATIGGTPTSGPPGTGGTAGGPALGNR
jgi:collagen type III alpha